jgi:hypothetical protein
MKPNMDIDLRQLQQKLWLQPWLFGGWIAVRLVEKGSKKGSLDIYVLSAVKAYSAKQEGVRKYSLKEQSNEEMGGFGGLGCLFPLLCSTR